MTLLKNEKGEHSIVTLEFSVEQKVFEDAVSAVYKEKAKNITVPGYRKGHAPRNLIEKMYGKGVFHEDAINKILPDAYHDALDAAGIKPIGNAEFDIVSMDGDIVLSAKVPVKPELDISDYKGIEVTNHMIPVTDEEVDNEIKKVQDRNSREIEVENRAAENGDTVVIDYEGFIDNVPFEGGKGENHRLKLGSGEFILGFEDQICGHNKGDAFDVNVSFPEDYHAEDLKGKPAVFKCELKQIYKVEVPALDDEFAKDVSEFDTFEEYKADVREKITKRHEKQANDDLETEIITKLSEKLVADIPEVMYNQEVENILRNFDMNLQSQGLNLQQYMKYTGLTLDSMRNQFRGRAEARVKGVLSLEAVARKEGFTATDDEINEEIAKIAKSYKLEVDKARELLNIDDVKLDVLNDKAIKFLKENVVVVEKKDDEKETTAEKKKPAAKKATAKKAEAKEAEAKDTEAKAPAKKTAAKKTAAKKSSDMATEEKAE